MAVQHLGVVKRLFLYEPSIANIIRDPDDAKAAADDRAARTKAAVPMIRAGRYAEAVPLYVDGLNGEDGKFDGMPAWQRNLLLWNSRTIPLTAPPPPPIPEDDLRGLDIPVAIGDRAGVLYQIVARTAKRLLPRAEVTIAPDAQHVWPIEAPADFARMVQEWSGLES